jgi:ketosteroid isomerase-like protein
MAQHPAEKLLADLYDKFATGDVNGFLAMCHDDIEFHVPGSVPFSGVHTKATFGDWIGKVMQICGGTFGERPVEIIANDDHGVVILDHWLERDGRRIEYRVDHIWEMRDGKMSRFRERPGNEAEFNAAWS